MKVARPVVSCPYCLRQYAVDPSISGKLGQCGRCRSCFTVVISTLSPEAEATVFENELQPHLNFFKEGCHEFIVQSRDLLTLAGKAVTIARVVMIAESIPLSLEALQCKTWREGYCSEMLERAHNQWQKEKGPRPDVFQYFLEYLPTRDIYALDMLQAAMSSLIGIDWTPDPPRKPGRLERWAAQRGL